MVNIVLAFGLVLFYEFCARWLQNWTFDGSGISSAAFEAKCKELEEAEKQQEPSKIRRLFRDPKPSQKELYNWILENSSTPEVFNRRNMIDSICSIVPALFAIRMLLGEINFWGISAMPATWYWAWLVYDTFFLIVGIIYNRTHK